jgi:MalT-like TPR region/Bacterial regulatory proteins, luxR family
MGVVHTRATSSRRRRPSAPAVASASTSSSSPAGSPPRWTGSPASDAPAAYPSACLGQAPAPGRRCWWLPTGRPRWLRWSPVVGDPTWLGPSLVGSGRPRCWWSAAATGPCWRASGRPGEAGRPGPAGGRARRQSPVPGARCPGARCRAGRRLIPRTSGRGPRLRLERLYRQAAAQGRTGSVIELRALQALALNAIGDQAGALAALAEALALAGAEGYVRVFVDEGTPMAHLLGRLAGAQRAGQVVLPASVPPHYLDRLMRAFQRGGRRPAPPATRGAAGVEGLVEPLSDRERQVLGLLAAGRSNQQIADELVVALGTVKSTSATSSTAGGSQPHPGGRPRPSAGAAALRVPA